MGKKTQSGGAAAPYSLLPTQAISYASRFWIQVNYFECRFLFFFFSFFSFSPFEGVFLTRGGGLSYADPPFAGTCFTVF